MSDPRHPKSSYEPRYPYNQVIKTPGGHEIHVDDTKGKERLRIAHRSGTYSEVSPDGRRVDMTVGHLIQYVKGGVTLTADKNADLKFGGSLRTNVSGDSHTEVAGSSSSATGGDSTHMVGGDHTQAVGGDHTTGVVGKQTTKVGGGQDVKVDGDSHTKVGGSSSLEVAGSHTISIGGVSMTVTAGGIAFTGGRITHNGHYIDSQHEHTGVQPGGGLTGPPV